MNSDDAFALSPDEHDVLKELMAKLEEFNQVVARTRDNLTRFFGTSNPVPYGGTEDSEHLQKLRENDPRAFSAWTHEEETLLSALVDLRFPQTLISQLTGRSQNSIKIKIRKMNELETSQPGSNQVASRPTTSANERGVDRGPQSLNKHGMVNPPPTGGSARDTI